MALCRVSTARVSRNSPPPLFSPLPDVITPALFPRRESQQLHSLLIRIGFLVQSPDSRCLFSVRGEEKRFHSNPNFSDNRERERDRPLRAARALIKDGWPSPSSLFHHPSLISSRRIARDDHRSRNFPTSRDEVLFLFPAELRLSKYNFQWKLWVDEKMDTRRCPLVRKIKIKGNQSTGKR